MNSYKNNPLLWFRFCIHCSNPIDVNELRDYLIFVFHRFLSVRLP